MKNMNRETSDTQPRNDEDDIDFDFDFDFKFSLTDYLLIS